MNLAQFYTDYLRFHDATLDDPRKKTKVIFVMKPDGTTKLGEIKWYGPWRQYAFFPSAARVFNTACLETILDVVKFMNYSQRQSRREEK